MDDAHRAEWHLLVKCGARQKPWFNMCRTTTRQEFLRRMNEWLGDESPQDFTTYYYNKISKQMIQLNDNEECYLAPIFDSIPCDNSMTGVQLFGTNDGHYVDLFISVKGSSPEIFAEQYQVHMDQLVAQCLNSTTIGNPNSSENSSYPTVDDLLNNDLFNCDDDEQEGKSDEDIQLPTTTPFVSPTTNIQFQLTDHIVMVHDVCPTPERLTYMSNSGKKGKSRLGFLSGVRGPNDRGKQIRPILQIPAFILQLLQENNSLDLIVACVQETLKDGMRMFWIDMNSEFYTKGCARTTPGNNPLEIPLTLKVIKNGEYKLEVILTRIPGKINQERKGELFHSVEDEIVRRLHPAEHDSQSSRVVFMIHNHGCPLINTIGFANFIQDPKKKKGTVSGNNGT